ncbi:MAG: helix-turn-helix transcriptional regulator [Acidimicrobiia bacterium]|nr:helix-turn-helix transcriptional regulator [Acidimicrobiia bacterium]
MSKPYQLACPVARSLEVVGDRWTLLIVRELLLAPLRYSQMQAHLDGIPPNLLADRLRLLEDEGIVERMDPRGYALSAKGRELAPVLDALAVWGMRHYDEPPSALAHHRGCGGSVRLTHTCGTCGAEVGLDELDLVPQREGRLR